MKMTQFYFRFMVVSLCLFFVLSFLYACSAPSEKKRLSSSVDEWSEENDQPLALSPLCDSFKNQSPPSTPAETEVIILHLNDFSGEVSPWQITYPGCTEPTWLGGAASIASLVQEWELAAGGSENLLLLDAGGLFTGSAEGDLTNGKLPLELWNQIGFDAIGLGPRDFSLGVPNLKSLALHFRGYVLCSNLRDVKTGLIPSWVQPWAVIEIKNVRVGLFGLVPPELETFLSRQYDSEKTPYIVLNPAETARLCVEELKSRDADVLIAFSSLGKERDEQLFSKGVNGVDLVIESGSRHIIEKFEDEEGDTFSLKSPQIHQVGSRGILVGEIRLGVDTKVPRIEKYGYRLLVPSIDRFPPDSEIEKTILGWQGRVDQELNKTITALSLPIPLVRGNESPLLQWAADQMRLAEDEASIGLLEENYARAPLELGAVTYRDLYSAFPSDRTMVIAKYKGSVIREALEASLAYGTPEGARTRLAISGLTVYYDKRQSPGQRVINVFVGGDNLKGEPLDPKRTYSVVLSSYLYHGNGNYEMFSRPDDFFKTEQVIRDVLKSALSRTPGWKIHESRWTEFR